MYLLTAQDLNVVPTFREALQRQGHDEGDEITSCAHQLLAEGEARKQIEMVEGLLRVGVTWDVIEAATRLTEASFQALKAQLSGSDSYASGFGCHRKVCIRSYLSGPHAEAAPIAKYDAEGFPTYILFKVLLTAFSGRVHPTVLKVPARFL